jgi:hypothetical protein
MECKLLIILFVYLCFSADSLLFCPFFISRWIRLLFGREFEIHSLLVLWDAIFAQDPTLQIVDYICLAILLRLRDQCKFSTFCLYQDKYINSCIQKK